MKLFLASQGFTTDEIAKEVEKLVGKPLKEINIAIINEAYVGLDGTKDKRWLIKELSNIEKYIGGVLDFVNFRAYSKEEIKKRLNMADLIYIIGGKQHLLEKLFREEELNLVDFNIIPHYMREDHKKWTKDFFERVLADNEFKVYAIKDSQAVVYNDGKIEFIGGIPDIFGRK